MSASWFVGELSIKPFVLGVPLRSSVVPAVYMCTKEKRSNLCPNLHVGELVCRRVRLSASLSVGELVCRRVGLSASCP